MTLTVPRAAADRFRAACRKCHPGRRGPDPPVRLTAAGGTLTLFASFGELGLALRVGPEVGLPEEDAPESPPVPEVTAAMPPGFPAALHEAGRTASREA